MLTPSPFQGLPVKTAAVCQTQLAPIKEETVLFPIQIQLDTVYLSGNLRSGTATIGQVDVSVKGHRSV